MALGVLEFDKGARVAFSSLANTPFSSGDSDDYCKAIIAAPGRPVVDVEINNTDAYTPYTVKIQGTRGTFRCTTTDYECKYVLPGENPPRPVVESFLANDKGDPVYCGEKLIVHEEKGKYDGTAFDVGTRLLYEDLYHAITEGREMYVTAEKAAAIIGVIETIHAENPPARALLKAHPAYTIKINDQGSNDYDEKEIRGGTCRSHVFCGAGAFAGCGGRTDPNVVRIARWASTADEPASKRGNRSSKQITPISISSGNSRNIPPTFPPCGRTLSAKPRQISFLSTIGD